MVRVGGSFVLLLLPLLTVATSPVRPPVKIQPIRANDQSAQCQVRLDNCQKNYAGLQTKLNDATSVLDSLYINSSEETRRRSVLQSDIRSLNFKIENPGKPEPLSPGPPHYFPASARSEMLRPLFIRVDAECSDTLVECESATAEGRTKIQEVQKKVETTRKNIANSKRENAALEVTIANLQRKLKEKKG